VFTQPVAIKDHAAATHLFRIAQEAVSNAIKHGKAQQIVISLNEARGRVILHVQDDGAGFPKKNPGTKGMGLRIMQSRAGMIGGTIAIEPNEKRGVSVICAVPADRSVVTSPNNHAGKIQEQR
jgi:signal transduction histidine kinase